jgi:hypothetical protein
MQSYEVIRELIPNNNLVISMGKTKAILFRGRVSTRSLTHIPTTYLKNKKNNLFIKFKIFRYLNQRKLKLGHTYTISLS